jgi:hypothetical protein
MGPIRTSDLLKMLQIRMPVPHLRPALAEQKPSPPFAAGNSDHFFE